MQSGAMGFGEQSGTWNLERGYGENRTEVKHWPLGNGSFYCELHYASKAANIERFRRLKQLCFSIFIYLWGSSSFGEGIGEFILYFPLLENTVSVEEIFYHFGEDSKRSCHHSGTWNWERSYGENRTEVKSAMSILDMVCLANKGREGSETLELSVAP